ncbi:MAG TPA: helix-hairpin-helix domain-containing protein [Blastocatellia bacterium]|nr:helix-hairpin-helix domain-containing protein [Blastocatellia bacterium]
MNQANQNSEAGIRRTKAAGFLLRFCLGASVCFLLLSPALAQQEERINLNTASARELMRLPGIGPTLAQRIVEHRHKHGPFRRPQDVIIVHRMNAKLYRRIAHLIRT